MMGCVDCTVVFSPLRGAVSQNNYSLSRTILFEPVRTGCEAIRLSGYIHVLKETRCRFRCRMTDNGNVT